MNKIRWWLCHFIVSLIIGIPLLLLIGTLIDRNRLVEDDAALTDAKILQGISQEYDRLEHEVVALRKACPIIGPARCEEETDRIKTEFAELKQLADEVMDRIKKQQKPLRTRSGIRVPPGSI